MGHAIIDAGADIIVGHHPHVLQGIEEYKNKLIFYSLGNLLFDQKGQGTDESAVVSVTIRDKRIASFRVLPIDRRKTYLPRLAAGEEKERIQNNILKFSNSLNALGHDPLLEKTVFGED